MSPRLAVLLILAAIPALPEDWSPKLAAQYLDSRQKEWFAWPRAKAEGGPCVSCHTGMTYLLARPSLRRALGETQPTPYEIGLLGGLRARVLQRDPQALAPGAAEPRATQKLGTEAIFAALFLGLQDGSGPASSGEVKLAFDRLWAVQAPDGKDKGGWAWIDAGVDPWETPEASFYGAGLAALAVGIAPFEYGDLEIPTREKALAEYLQREQQGQALHHRLTLLWASSRWPDALPKARRQPLIDEVLQKQQPDGGWTIESLGPWAPRPKAPPSAGSSSYATGFVAFVLQKGGVKRSHPGLERALAWLQSHQDREFGYWPADSMNKVYEPDSMPVRFMRDAATAFASLALLDTP